MLRVKFVDFPVDVIQTRTIALLEEAFGEVELSDDPDFLFYSAFGHEHLKYDCVRIFWTGENIQPDFNICDYAIGFGRMTFEDRYRRIPLYYFYEEDYKKAIEKHEFQEAELAKKNRFCNFIYSNGMASPEREQFFRLLSRYKRVDSGGGFLNNIGGPVSNKYEFQQHYKFSIAFENSSMSGYATEKILQAFAAKTIPIYWGDPKIGEDFNERAFINCHNYKSFEEVVEAVKEIDRNDDLFLSYLREPIGTKERFPDNPLLSYEEFVKSICQQTPAEAMRRSNIMRGQFYQEEQRSFYFPEKRGVTERLKQLPRFLVRGIAGRKGIDNLL
ncbi:MAG: glycosyltransferase family 10 [Eubacteriales bacterium]|nr:glycosyltransferase family 10 [Eubacteriales bacterium]